MTADEIRKELKTVKEQQEKLVFDRFFSRHGLGTGSLMVRAHGSGSFP